MADQKHTVEVEIVTNAKQLREEMKGVTSQANKLSDLSSRMQKSGLKGHKEVAKLSKGLKKQDSKGFKESIKAEKKLQDSMKRTAAAMREKLKAGKANVQVVEQELAKISKLESAHRKLQKQRKGLYGETKGERARGAMKGLGKGAGGALKGIGGGLAMGGAAIGGALVSFITSQLTSGYAAYKQYGQAAGALTGMGGSRAELRRAKNLGVDMGFGPVATAQQARQVGRQTGNIGAVTEAQRLSRSTGMDVSEAGGFMGSLARGGRGFKGAGASGKQDVIKTLAAGFESGLDRARMPEYMQGVSKLVEQQGAVTAGDVDPASINKILSAFGASGQSGLQGARGSSVLAKLDKAVKAPGGGEAGQATVLRALGFGQPGGETSYYEALKMQQRGITGKGGAQVLQKLFKQTKQEYGGGEQQALALNKLTDLTLDQVEAVREVIEDGGLSGKEKREKISKITEESKSIDEQIRDSLDEFGDIIEQQAKVQDHDVRIGEDISKEVHAMQDMFNTLMEDMMPAIKTALKTIVSILEDIFKGLRQFMGWEAKPEEKSVQNLRDVKKKFWRGDASLEEYQAHIYARQSMLEQQQSDMEEHYGGRLDDPNSSASMIALPEAKEKYKRIKERRSVEKERLKKLRDRFGNFDTREEAELARLVMQREGINTNKPGSMRDKYSDEDEGKYTWGKDAKFADFSPGGDLHGLIDDAMNKMVEKHGSMAAAVEALSRKLNEGSTAGNRPEGSAEADTSGGAH